MVDNLNDNHNTILTTIETARQEGSYIHDMMDQEQFPGVTAWLAEQGLYTTGEPQDPGKFWHDFRPQSDVDRELDELEANARTALTTVEEFRQAQEAGRLGLKLMEVFRVENVELENLHVTNPKTDDSGRIIEGTSTTEWTVFTVKTIDERELLSDAIHALARTGAIDKIHAIRARSKEDGSGHTIRVSNMNKYTTQMMEIAVARIVARDMKELTDTDPSGVRMPLSVREAGGETFHPLARQWMVGVNEDYKRLSQTATATYREGTLRTSLESELARKPEALSSTPAAVFEVLRKAHNSVIRAMHGSGQFNQDQNPDKSWRLLIEEGVNIKREYAGPGYPGQPSLRALSAKERGLQRGKEIVETQRKHPIKAAVKTSFKVITAGVELIGDIATEVVPWAKSRGIRLSQDLRAWRQQKRAAIATGARIDEVVARARAQQEEEQQ